MRDTFTEYLVEKKRTGKTKFAKALLVCAGLLLILAAVLALIRRSLLLSLTAVLILSSILYSLTTAMNIEYEYSVTNGEMDVDQITAKRKRKRLITVDCRRVQAFGRYDARVRQTGQYAKKIYACDSRSGTDLWYCAVDGDGGVTLVVFNATDTMLEGIRPFLPHSVASEAFRGER